VGIDSTRETMATSVTSWPKSVVVKFSTIVKIYKYKRFHEGHHFILMIMEVHSTPGRDMDHFIKECAPFFHDRRLRGHLSLTFCIQFFKQHVSIITFQCALTFVIERKIMLVKNACSRPLITRLKSHDLHANNIRRDVGEIVSYHERD